MTSHIRAHALADIQALPTPALSQTITVDVAWQLGLLDQLFGSPNLLLLDGEQHFPIPVDLNDLFTRAANGSFGLVDQQTLTRPVIVLSLDENAPDGESATYLLDFRLYLKLL